MEVGLSQEASRTGYLKVELLNDGSLPVYFDSVTIRHPRTELRISQEHHYYPFGMNLQGVAVNTQPAAAISKAQFNGGSELEEELMDEGGVYSTPYRTYDPTIGRFQGVDPLADMYADQTPYNFAFNDPANLNDPSGADPLSDLALNNPTLGNTLVFAAQGYGDPGGSGFGGFNTYGRLPAGGSASYSGGLLNVSGTTVSTSVNNAPTYSSWAFSIAGLTNGVGSLGLYGEAGWIGQTTNKGGVEFNRLPVNRDENYMQAGKYTPPPRSLPGFPDAKWSKPKGGRKRWTLPDGDILEWDGEHGGELERYNPRGKHIGVWNSQGRYIKDPVKGRKITPFTDFNWPKIDPAVVTIGVVVGVGILIIATDGMALPILAL